METSTPKYDNLFVCDCSVIPEAWGMPPTTTIIGLGKRLAKYLSDETKQQKLEDNIGNIIDVLLQLQGLDTSQL